MLNIKRIIRNEITGWKRGEVIWLVVSCLIIASLSIYWGDSLMGIISATTGVACVVCTGKGKLSAYLFGMVNCILYAIISYKATLYGEAMLNAIYYAPMQFVGFYVWYKNMNEETKEVNKRRMNGSKRVMLVIGIAVATIIYGLVLNKMGDGMPYIDSFTTVASVYALVISIRMYAEQWFIWFVVDALSVYMWWCDFQTGSDNMATLLMWIVYWVNAVIMMVRWEKEAMKKTK